jgi:hypothetical protein
MSERETLVAREGEGVVPGVGRGRPPVAHQFKPGIRAPRDRATSWASISLPRCADFEAHGAP